MGSRDAKKIAHHLNFVHNDEIWKDHVRHEFMSQRYRWPERWGFLVHDYEELHRNLKGSRAPTPYYETGHRFDPHAAKDKKVKLPPIRSSNRVPFPVTTTQGIGWVAAQKHRQLEIYGQCGPRSRGQCGILRLLSWPQESSP